MDNRRQRFLPHVEMLEPRCCLAAVPVITEVMASNDRTLRDGEGRASDWIEIHNAGDEALDLSGWALTDDSETPRKWTFPAATNLTPGEYVIVFASGTAYENGRDAAGYLHAQFRLDADGEYLALVDSSGAIRQAFAPALPTQYRDVAYGLANSAQQPATGVFGYLEAPTPGRANGAAFASVTTATVDISPADRTFVDSVQVEMQASIAGLPIFYTLDGSVPTSSSAQYTTPLSIQQSAQVRARVIEPNSLPGKIATRSLLRLAPSVASKAAELPIAIIDNFGAGAIPNAGWNQTNAGIQQVARQSASLMLFQPNQSISSPLLPPALSSRVGIRIRGAFSSSFQKPGYSLELWDQSRDDDAAQALLGMEAASDWVMYSPNPSYDETLMDNAFMFEIQRQMGHWTPDYQYVELYLNRDGGDVTAADYVGLYAFVERPERGVGRIDFPAFAADGSSGGWLLEINRMDSISEDGQLPKNFHTAGPNGVVQTARDLHNSSSTGDDIPRQSNA